MDYLKRVYLIDDDEDDCYFFKTAIEGCGHDVELLYDQDSSTALDNIFAGKVPIPDVLFLDWNMPKRSGKDCLKLIRQFPSYKEVPIIIYTTSFAHKDREDAQKLGASHFLTKPSSISDLQKKLKDILSINWA